MAIAILYSIWLALLPYQFPLPFPGPGRSASCLATTGTTLTESFGDASAYTCPDGTAGCNLYWIFPSGTSASITSSPGTPPANTACLKSISLPGGNANYASNIGSIPLIPTTAIVTWGGSYYWSSDSLANNANEIIASLTNGPGDGTQTACELYLKNVSGQRVLRARNANEGGATSFTANLNINSNTWYTWAMQCDLTATANNSCVSDTADLSCCGTGADTTNCKRFTASSIAVTGAVVGDHNNVAATNHYLGNVWINSSVGNTSGDSFTVSAESGSDGDALSTSILTNTTGGGSGTWSQVTPGGFTVSTSYNLAYSNSLDVASTTYAGSGTRSLRYDYSTNVNPSFRYTVKTNSPSATYCSRWTTDLSVSLGTFAAYTAIATAAGTDFVALMFNDGKVYLETADNPNGNPDVGSKYTYATNTTYVSCLQFNVGGPHKLWVWDSTCSTQLSYQEKTAVSGATANPTRFSVGRADASGALTGSIWFDNLWGNYKAPGNTPTCH